MSHPSHGIVRNGSSISVIGLVLLLVWGHAPLFGEQSLQKLDDAAAIKAARDGLARHANFPWYDDQADALRRVELAPPAPPPEAGNWTASTRKEAKSGNWQWPATFGELFAKMLQFFAWAILAGVLCFGVYLAFRMLLETDISLSSNEQRVDDRLQTDAERMENLPFDIRRPHADLLAEVRRQYEAGNYRDAIVYLFSYQLVQLDKHHWIRLTKGKTNRQYLREIRKRTDMSELLRQSMVTFEDVFFGHHPLDRKTFESCWNRMDEFHRWVQPEGNR